MHWGWRVVRSLRRQTEVAEARLINMDCKLGLSGLVVQAAERHLLVKPNV
jgi:hypothetical protein